MKARRIAILGGTFDPPHMAHLTMAESALEHLPIEKVLFVPAPDPPHKRSETPYASRTSMVGLALEGREGMELSRLEEFRSGPSYTVELLEHYSSKHADDLYFIMGSDSLSDFSSWKNPGRILELATLVVFTRPGFFSRVPVQGSASVILFQEEMPDISSRDIRDKVRKGEDVSALLPRKVYDFILNNSLYSC